MDYNIAPLQQRSFLSGLLYNFICLHALHVKLKNLTLELEHFQGFYKQDIFILFLYYFLLL